MILVIHSDNAYRIIWGLWPTVKFITFCQLKIDQLEYDIIIVSSSPRVAGLHGAILSYQLVVCPYCIQHTLNWSMHVFEWKFNAVMSMTWFPKNWIANKLHFKRCGMCALSQNHNKYFGLKSNYIYIYYSCSSNLVWELGDRRNVGVSSIGCGSYCTLELRSTLLLNQLNHQIALHDFMWFLFMLISTLQPAQFNLNCQE